MPSEFTTFRRHVLSLPGRNSPEGQQGCNALDGRASQLSVRRYRDGELGTDVNLIRKEPDCGGKRHETKGADPCSGVETPVWN